MIRDWDSVLAALGHGGLKEGQIINRLLEEFDKKRKKEITDSEVLEAISQNKEKNTKVRVAKSKSGIIVKVFEPFGNVFTSPVGVKQ